MAQASRGQPRQLPLLPHRGQNQVAIMPTALEFLENHGKNILLSNGNRTATRVASYNQGIVVINQPLVPQLLVQVGLTSSSAAPLTQGHPGPSFLEKPQTEWRQAPGMSFPGFGSYPAVGFVD